MRARPSLLLMTMALGCAPPELVAATTSESSTDAGSSSTNTDSGSESGSETGAEPSCGFTFVPELTPALVMLVVDTSASMGEPWDHDGDPLTPEVTRWSSARALIENLLAKDDGSLLYGLQRYPSANACAGGPCSDADVCLLADAPEVAPAPATSAGILAALPPADAQLELVGGSPARAAFMAATPLLDRIELVRTVALITDGASNCSEGAMLPGALDEYDDALASVVLQAYDDNITTVVVGIGADDAELPPGEDSPQVNPFAALNELALNGGAPWGLGQQPRKFHGVDQLDEILEALHGGLSDDYTCDFDLTQTIDGPPPPEQVASVEVVMDGVVVPLADDCGAQDGWAWIEPGLILTLCGATCDLLRDASSFEVSWDC